MNYYKTESEWQQEIDFNLQCIEDCELERMTVPLATMRIIEKERTNKALYVARKRIEYELNRDKIRAYQNERYARLKNLKVRRN